jgi:hypothetical protein
LLLTLGYATVVAILIWQAITASAYSLPDDTRPHIAWMQRFTDPDLFTHDIIADYFQAVSPIGYAGVYRLLAGIGISPLQGFQIVAPMVVVLSAIAVFWACVEISALPAAGFAAAAMLCQSIEFTTAVATGTSKAFIFVSLFVFIVAWLRQSLVGIGICLVLQGLLAPQVVLISGGIMTLEMFSRALGRWRIGHDHTHRHLVIFGLTVAAIVVLGYALPSHQFGPTIRAEQALQWPEFLPGGRNQFFRPDIVDFLLYGRSGLRLDTALTPVTNGLALALPLFAYFPRQFPLAIAMVPRIRIVGQLVASALICFLVAHGLLFRLHLPSRYAGRFLLASFVLAGGIASVILLDALLQGLIAMHTRRRPGAGTWMAWPTTLLMGGIAIALPIIVVLYPLTMSGYPFTSLVQGQAPALYEYLATQPKTSAIAGLSTETSNIPSFAGRTVITSPEVSLPYHIGYYTQLRQRNRDVITAQYTLDPTVISAVIKQYGITHWLLDDTAFDLRQMSRNRWIQQYQPEANTAVSILASQQVPVVQQRADQCTTFQTGRFRVLDARCLATPSPSSTVSQ